MGREVVAAAWSAAGGPRRRGRRGRSAPPRAGRARRAPTGAAPPEDAPPARPPAARPPGRSDGGGGGHAAAIAASVRRARPAPGASRSATVGPWRRRSTETVAVRDLVDRLAAARDAADRIAGSASLGLRAVERGRPPQLRGRLRGRRPSSACTEDLSAETSARRAREAASASLLWEHAEALVDAEALRELVRAIGRLLALGGEPAEVAEPLEVVAARALELAAWRDEPRRVVASLPDLDVASRLQERLVGAYARFVRASDPLVEAPGLPRPGADRGPAGGGGGRRRAPARPSGSPTGSPARWRSATRAPARWWPPTSCACAPSERGLRHRGLVPPRPGHPRRGPGHRGAARRGRRGLPPARPVRGRRRGRVRLPGGVGRGARRPRGSASAPRPAAELAALAERLGKAPRVRLYAMEESKLRS